MKKLYFNPWIGKNYSDGFLGKRILVLGESHYCANVNDAQQSLTQEIIRDLLDPNSVHEPYKNTYLKFEHALAGKKLDFTERAELWNKIAFYNFIQEPLSGPREAPNRELFLRGEEPFFEVVNKLSPDVILVWGKRLYENLPQKGEQLPDILMEDMSSIECWSYTSESGVTALVLPMCHPSAAFSTDYWHEAISKAIENASTKLGTGKKD